MSAAECQFSGSGEGEVRGGAEWRSYCIWGEEYIYTRSLGPRFARPSLLLNGHAARSCNAKTPDRKGDPGPPCEKRYLLLIFHIKSL